MEIMEFCLSYIAEHGNSVEVARALELKANLAGLAVAVMAAKEEPADAS